MTVTAVRKDPQALTMTIEAEFDATPERVWQLWADPRKLERWWGPPGYPATVTWHDLTRGGHIEYHMIGPDGAQHHGYWDVVEVEAPHRLALSGGIANDDGTPKPPLGTMYVRIEAIGAGRTRMSLVSSFPNSAAMEEVLAMGTLEGQTQAVGQIDAILSEGAASHVAGPSSGL